MKSDDVPFKTDLAFKSDSGIYFYSIKDQVLNRMYSDDVSEITVTDNDFEDSMFGYIPSEREIGSLFRRLINGVESEFKYQIGESKYIGLFDEHTRMYAVAIGKRKVYNKEIFDIVTQTVTEEISQFLTRNNVQKQDEISIDEFQLSEQFVAQKIAARYLSFKVYGNSNDKRGNEFYETCCLLSCTPYEKAQNHGRLGILTDSTGKKSAYIRFQQPIEVKRANVRAIRKLLQMSDKRNLLMMMDGEITGIFTPKSSYSYSEILFHGHGKWDYTVNNSPIISFHAASVSINDYEVDNKLSERLDLVFVGECDKEKLKRIVSTAEKQSHGTTIIITDHAQEECDRLKSANRVIQIDPTEVEGEKDIILSITSIDGAVLVDPNGICYAIGVILDGEAISEGNISRGARYNSAITYVDYRKKNGEKVIAVIISEDESTDVYSGRESQHTQIQQDTLWGDRPLKELRALL